MKSMKKVKNVSAGKPTIHVLRWENGFVNIIQMVNFGMPGAMIPQEVLATLPPAMSDRDKVDVIIYDIKGVKKGWDELLGENKNDK